MNNPQTPSAADIRLSYFQTIAASKVASECLHNMIDLVADHSQEINPISAINELAESWITDSGTDWDDPQTTRNLRTVLRLSTFLTKLRETYTAFENEANELTYGDEEGENE